MGRGHNSQSPLSLCSDRVVPVADSSELKHEHTHTAPQPGVFVLCHFSKCVGVGEKLTTAPNTDNQLSARSAPPDPALKCWASLPICDQAQDLESLLSDPRSPPCLAQGEYSSFFK